MIINNPKYIERAEIIREKGTDRSKFIRGEVQKYQWVDQGSSYLLAEVLAAQLLGQLESFDKIQERRQRIFDIYSEELTNWSKAHKFEKQFTPSKILNSAHMFYLVAGSRESRDSLIQKLYALEIQAVFHYRSLADSIQGAKYPSLCKPLIISNNMSNQLLRLPLYYDLDDNTQTKIIEAIVG